MKTITERDGKNVNMQVVGDLHQYPDGSLHTVKEGKAVWEEGGGAGYGVKETRTTLFDGVATTESFGSINRTVLLAQDTNAPTIFVTFDGEEYTLERTEIAMGTLYGDAGDSEPSFANIPFAILSRNLFTFLYTESAGTHSVKIETFEQSVEPTPEFEAAVASVSNVYIVNISTGDRVGFAFDKTASEIFNAMQRTGVICVFSSSGAMSVHNLSAAVRSRGSEHEYVFTIEAKYPINGTTGDIEFQATNGDDYPSTQGYDGG